MARADRDRPGLGPGLMAADGEVGQAPDHPGEGQTGATWGPESAYANGAGAAGWTTGTDPALRPPPRPLAVGSPNGLPGPQIPRPGRRNQRSQRGRRVVQGRRSRRVVRRIDVWTVLKLSFLFYLCVLLVLLVAGVVLWNVALAFDVIHSVEKFIRSLFDLQTFTLHPDVILEASAVGGFVLALLGTATNVLVALLYNLISDIVGGVQVIVLEEARPPEATLPTGAVGGAEYAPGP